MSLKNLNSVLVNVMKSSREQSISCACLAVDERPWAFGSLLNANTKGDSTVGLYVNNKMSSI